MKKFNKFLVLIAVVLLPCVFIFSGCSLFEKKVYVTGIDYVKTTGDVDTYVVKYSNDTTTTFDVKRGADGADGKDGKDFDLDAVFKMLVKNGYYNESQYLDFLHDYLQVDNTVSIESAVNKSLQSAVTVYSEFPVLKENSYSYQKDVDISCGAGVIYKMNDTYSYIITNYHVVYEKSSETVNHIAQSVHIYQYGSNEIITKTKQNDINGYPICEYSGGAVECEYVGGSMTYDIAILKTQTSNLKSNNPTACAVTVTNDYSIAETVFAIGNPEGDGFSVTSGIVSKESEYLQMTAVDDETPLMMRVLRTDAAVNGGNSGGGLFNKSGELVGIVNAKLCDIEIDNMAYALPVDNITKVADNLIYYYEKNGSVSPSSVYRVYLGIQSHYLPEESTSQYNPATNKTEIIDSLEISGLAQPDESQQSTLAMTLGLQVGDIIASVSINGKLYNLQQAFEFSDILLTARVGDSLEISVNRKNEQGEFTNHKLALDKLPSMYFNYVD